MKDELYMIKADGTLRRAPTAKLTKDGSRPLTADEKRALGYRPLVDEKPQPAGGTAKLLRYEWRDASDAPVRSPRLRDHIAAVYEVVTPPRVFETADLIEALMAESVWAQAKAWIEAQGLLDLVLATKEFDENNANFQAGKAALQTALGWTDAEVEEFLVKCAKGGA